MRVQFSQKPTEKYGMNFTNVNTVESTKKINQETEVEVLYA